MGILPDFFVNRILGLPLGLSLLFGVMFVFSDSEAYFKKWSQISKHSGTIIHTSKITPRKTNAWIPSLKHSHKRQENVGELPKFLIKWEKKSTHLPLWPCCSIMEKSVIVSLSKIILRPKKNKMILELHRWRSTPWRHEADRGMTRS